MQVLMSWGNIQHSDAVEAHTEERVRKALHRFADRVTRVEVHVNDLNGPKAGLDMRCMMEARLAGMQPIAVEHTAFDLYDAINGSAERLERAVARRVDKHSPTHP